MAYRIESSTLDAIPLNSPFRAALRRRGIVDHVNALPPRHRKRVVQMFIMEDGRMIPDDTRVLSECVREAGKQ